MSHANHAALRTYFAAPTAAPATLLRQAALDHYSLHGAPSPLVEQALAAWQAFDAAVDDWALVTWCQRFSFAIGRDAARGLLYRPFVPAELRACAGSWAMSTVRGRGVDFAGLTAHLQADRTAFLAVAARFTELADTLAAAGCHEGAALARREGHHLELAGELLPSVGRMLEATEAFAADDAPRLRVLVLAEIAARERHLEISGTVGWGGGVNAPLVEEDLHNMRLFLARADFPHPPDDVFHFTLTPYSV